MNTNGISLIGVAVTLIVAVSVSGSNASAHDSKSNNNGYVDYIDDLLQAWDRRIDKPSRFVVLKEFRKEAVLDRETQLVWQRATTDVTSGAFYQGDFFNAIRHCYSITTGGRMGWRVPTAEELTSLLVEQVIPPGVTRAGLPPGHPFINIQQTRYWSISEGSFSGAVGRYVVAPNNPQISQVDIETNLGAIHPTWCVRGPGGGQSTR